MKTIRALKSIWLDTSVIRHFILCEISSVFMNEKITKEMSNVELELERDRIETSLKYSMQNWWYEHSEERNRLSEIQSEINRRKEAIVEIKYDIQRI